MKENCAICLKSNNKFLWKNPPPAFFQMWFSPDTYQMTDHRTVRFSSHLQIETSLKLAKLKKCLLCYSFGLWNNSKYLLLSENKKQTNKNSLNLLRTSLKNLFKSNQIDHTYKQHKAEEDPRVLKTPWRRVFSILYCHKTINNTFLLMCFAAFKPTWAEGNRV